MQILILGMHRSGTSVLARLLYMMGAYFGPDGMVMRSTDENGEGSWGRRDVRVCNDELLASVGCRWDRVVDYQPTSISPDARQEFEDGARVVIQELDAHRPWVMDEPRLCINLPRWLPLLQHPVCLFFVRDPIEIAQALSARNGIPLPIGIVLTRVYYSRAVEASSGLARAIVVHGELVSDPVGATKRICMELLELGVRGLTMPTDTEILAVIDPNSNRWHGTPELSSAYLTLDQSRFFEVLSAADWSTAAESAHIEGPERELLRLYESDLERRTLESALRACDGRIHRLVAMTEKMIGAALEDLDTLERSRSWRLGHSVCRAGARLLARPIAGSSGFDPLRERLFRARDAVLAPRVRNHSRGPHAAQADSTHVASRLPGCDAESLPVPQSDLTVAVIAWDTGHNPLGRAYLIAEALARHFHVLLIGPGFPRFGTGVWHPLRNAAVTTIRLPGEDLPAFAHRVERIAPRIAADVVIACKARMPSLELGLAMKAFRKRPLLVDVDDYELAFFENRHPLGLRELQALSRHPQVRLPFSEPWTRYAETLLPHADQIIVSNVALQGKFGGIVIPHARDENRFDPERYDRTKVRTALGYAPEHRVVLFLGTPRPHKGVLEVAAAIRAYGDSRYRFCLIGNCPDAALEQTLREVGGDSIQLVADQPFCELPRYLMVADVVCLLQDPISEISKYQLPAKAIDALAMGVPVLSTSLPPLQPLIDAGAVRVTDMGDFAWVLKDVLDDRDRLRQEQCQRRSLFLEHYSYAAIGGHLSDRIQALLRRDVPDLDPQVLAFMDLQKALGDRDAPEVRPDQASGRDCVLFWKQNDSGLYGRRVDMLAKYLVRHPGVNRVLLVDAPIGIESLMQLQREGGVTHARRIFAETWRKHWGLADDDGIDRNVFVYSDRTTEPKGAVWKWPMRQEYLAFLGEWFAQLGVDPRRAVFVLYPTNESIRDLLQGFRPGLVVADVVDDQRTWPNLTPATIDALTTEYRDVIARADLVIANCDRVQQSMSAFGKQVELLPNACEIEVPPMLDESPEAEFFRGLPGPRIGYVGNLEAKIDVELLHRLAESQPDWQIILIGSTHANPAVLELEQHSNVHLFGVIEYPRVRSWIAEFDVAIIPHLDTPQTRSMNPLKLYVYASVGVPVVATRIDNLGELAGWVTIAESHDGFVTAIKHQLGADLDARGEEMRAVLARNSWQVRVEQLMCRVDAKLTDMRARKRTGYR